MTNEDIQRTMEFILAQQSQFAANIQRLQEERIRDNPRLTRLEESFQLLVRLAENSDTRLYRLESGTSTLEASMAALLRRKLTRMNAQRTIDIVVKAVTGRGFFQCPFLDRRPHAHVALDGSIASFSISVVPSGC